jgi:OOP family OmpA-OmpF porin
MQKKLLAALLGAALVLPVAAQAEGSYFKVDVGQSKYKNDLDKENEMAASIAYGFSVDKNFGVELGYINFGKIKDVGEGFSGLTQRQALYLAGVGSLPLTDAFSVFAKLGVALNRYEDKFVTDFSSELEKVTKTKSMVGLGLAYNFTKDIAGTLEYQYFGKIGSDAIKVSTVTLGVKYGF